MKKTLIATAIAATAILSNSAFAGSFDGVNVDLGIGGANTSTNVNAGNFWGDDTGVPGAPFSNKTNSGDFAGIASLGYSQEIGSGFNLAANLFYVIGHQRGGAGGNSAAMSDPTAPEVNLSLSQNVSTKLNNTWGIAIEPGYYFGKDTLGYAKLAWVNSNLSANAAWSGNAVDTMSGATMSMSDSQNFSSNINGFGYGLGVKQKITDNWYAKAEVFGVSYGTASFGEGGLTAKPNQVFANIGVGYTF